MTTEKPGLSPAEWQKRYEDNDMRWDLAAVSPPFARLWEEGRLNPGRLIIPGCGRGHEAIFFAERGFEITAVDFAPSAVNHLRQSLQEKNLAAQVLQQDFFTLDAAHDARYGLMLEQTFFCAIHPDLRPAYVDTASRILRKDGQLVALFYETGEAGGPPFTTTRDDVLRLFTGKFAIDSLEKTPHSIERRQGKEWLGFLRRK